MDYVEHYVIMGLMLQFFTLRFGIVAPASLKQLVHSDDPALLNGLPPEDYVRGAAHELLNQLTVTEPTDRHQGGAGLRADRGGRWRTFPGDIHRF